MVKRSILGKELADCKLEELVVEATSGAGTSLWGEHVMAGTLPCVVIVAVGPAAEVWLEIYDTYLKQVQVDQARESNG